VFTHRRAVYLQFCGEPRRATSACQQSGRRSCISDTACARR
jgi:hypothetical protein